MTDDAQLLRQYANERAEPAFGELVARHIDLVFSAALRVVGGDRHLAQDVTQTVFADLARKAGNLPHDVVLAGWLYRHACFTAAKAVRAERRRQAREKTAMEMNALHDSTEPNWEQIAPVLDEALNQLSASDRDAVVLRFLKRQDFRAVGSALGVGEDAAQKRVSRAVDKLRNFLSRRGVTLTATALGTTLATEAVVAAPAGLAVSVTATSLAGTAAAGTGISATLMKLMAMTKFKTIVISAIVVTSVVTPLTLQHQSLNRMRQENLMLRQQADELAQLREANTRLAKLQVDADELERLRQEHSELMRRRGEVASLRGIKDELARLKDETQRSQSDAKQAADEFVPADKFVDAGLATPEAAIQTLCFAALTGNKKRYRQAVDWTEVIPTAYELSGKHDPNWTPDKVWFTVTQFPGRFQGFQILSQKQDAPDEAEVEIARHLKLGNTETREITRLTFRRIGAEWKWRILSPADVVYIPFDTTVNERDGSGNPAKSN